MAVVYNDRMRQMEQGMESQKALKERLNRMVEDMARYDERLALLADTNRRLDACADQLDVALKDARYWKDRAEKAEAEVAMRPVTPDVL